eukprot:CAMPEP_0179423788 /NCGR_PEP_ID=MMETSP0799-20121207/11213_1 /TAXON_ID=46947 /ORGANISM="Geminigera cryophila, Strain CCMP2564" /LENGTH=569 /DNA_ID=CAMNT_0021198139 /DNA_START=33 /DNA_END=1742 /DNA_ORIENTATION=+
MWDARTGPQMWQLSEKEDPYSYYRGKAESFANMTNGERTGRFFWIGTPLGAFVGTMVYYYLEDQKKWKAQEVARLEEGDEQTITNWSGTHEVTTKRFYQPTSMFELEEYVAKAHRNKTRLRVMGAGLSPNGIGLDEDGMISLALMDSVLSVDPKKRQVTVQAGARVSQVLEALKPYGLTLQNLASINEQQIGGFMSVSAHGSGVTLPPVDEQVVSYKLVTPALGTLTLSKDDPEDSEHRFEMARVGLGALGVVAEVTLRCVPAHQLHECTWVSTMADVEKQHAELVTNNRHIRYMWIPYTESVVVVTSNPVKPWYSPGSWLSSSAPAHNKIPEEERLRPMRTLLQTHGVTAEMSASLPQLRDELLKIDPLNVEHIKHVNAAEAECWKMMQGERIEWSDKVLGFECGGQQWVSEICFAAGSAGTPNGRDLQYARELLQLIQDHQIPAPSPLEQRWTSASSSPMSPAHSKSHDDVFSWLGVIMYLPPDDPQQRHDISEAFSSYKELCRTHLWPKFSCKEHWAKIEVPADRDDKQAVRQRLQESYPVPDFMRERSTLDPNNILANKLVNALF